MKRWPSLAMALCLIGCGDQTDTALTETVVAAPWREVLIAQGELKPATRTLLKVPGSNWESRRLIWLKPDGSPVKKGELLAQFDAPEAQSKFDQSSLELLRTALKQAEATATAGINQAQLATEIAQVDSDFVLSDRYARADVGAFSRNQILDAVQDIGFLTDKKDFLGWKRGQTSVREASANALVTAQGQTVQQQVERARKSLSDLEVRAPNDGVFALIANWDGSKPEVGVNLYASEEFAELPDPASLQVELSVPQAQAAGLRDGLPVSLRVAGAAQAFTATLSSVGANPSTRERQSPVKFITVTAKVPAEIVAANRLLPGQAVRAEVVLVERDEVLTVPNIALHQDGAQFFVRRPGVDKPHPVVLGLRGQARSEIKSGLQAGDAIVLTDADTPAKPAEAPRKSEPKDREA